MKGEFKVRHRCPGLSAVFVTAENRDEIFDRFAWAEYIRDMLYVEVTDHAVPVEGRWVIIADETDIIGVYDSDEFQKKFEQL